MRSDLSLFQVYRTAKKTQHGCALHSGSQSNVNSRLDTAVSWPSSLKEQRRRYQLDSWVFRCVLSHFEEIYGLSLDCDVFGDGNNSLLPVYGRCDVAEGTNLLVFTEPTLLSEITQFLRKVKTVALFVVPDWTNHDWHRHLMTVASHRFVLPLGSVSALRLVSFGTAGLRSARLR